MKFKEEFYSKLKRIAYVKKKKISRKTIQRIRAKKTFYFDFHTFTGGLLSQGVTPDFK